MQKKSLYLRWLQLLALLSKQDPFIDVSDKDYESVTDDD